MYKMKDYFFKYWQYYILFFGIWWRKRNHFIDISPIVLKFCSPLSSQFSLPSHAYSHYLCANVKERERYQWQWNNFNFLFLYELYREKKYCSILDNIATSRCSRERRNVSDYNECFLDAGGARSFTWCVLCVFAAESLTGGHKERCFDCTCIRGGRSITDGVCSIVSEELHSSDCLLPPCTD